MTHRHAVSAHPPEGADPDTGCSVCGSTDRVRWYQAHPNDTHVPYCRACLWALLTGPKRGQLGGQPGGQNEP